MIEQAVDGAESDGLAVVDERQLEQLGDGCSGQVDFIKSVIGMEELSLWVRGHIPLLSCDSDQPPGLGMGDSRQHQQDGREGDPAQPLCELVRFHKITVATVMI
jgi:hypothetical protein